MNETSQAPSIISAVVAPAILILSCSSLITTTANRLSLLLDRVRYLTGEMEVSGKTASKRSLVAAQLAKGAERARLLQRTLATLYLALGTLLLTCVVVGFSTVTGLNTGLIGLTVLASVLFLFYASTLLVRESRIALSAIKEEMEYVRGLIAPGGT